MKKTKLKIVTIISTIALVVIILTSKVGTVVNSNYVEFKDGTGYYNENKNYTGKYKIFWCLDITDLLNRGVE